MISEEEFEELIKARKVISFDIFDTLLVRPFSKPTDIFRYMEKEYVLDGFAEERVLAEKRARKNIGKIEVTLDDIYSCINKKYFFCKSIELLTEEKFLKKNILIEKYFNLARKSNLIIICVSDMYLSSEFLKNILVKNGFDGIFKIFVSSEYNKTKSNGELFRYVLYDLKVNSAEVLHIGDNWESDCTVPSSIGISSVRVPRLTELFERRFGNLSAAERDSLGYSAYVELVSQSIIKYNEEGYWFNIGYSIGGGIALSYTRFAVKIAKDNKIDKLLFVARDGFVLNEVFRKFFNGCGCESEYVYLSRSVVQHADENLKRYLNLKIGSSSSVAVVDLTTSGFSAVKAIRKYISNVELYGIYSVTLNDFSPVPFFRFRKTNILEDYHKISEVAIELSEFILSSPESPIVFIDDNLQPKYHSEIGYREKVYPDIVKGILQYCLDYFDTFRDCAFCPDITFDDWVFISENFSNNRNDCDILNFNKVLKAKSSDNVSDSIPVSEIIFK